MASMKKIIKHLIIPAMFSALFFIIASLPAELLGCRNRGLIAAFVAIAAGVIGFVAAGQGLLGKIRGDENSPLWMASALILAVPAIYIVLPAA